MPLAEENRYIDEQLVFYIRFQPHLTFLNLVCCWLTSKYVKSLPKTRFLDTDQDPLQLLSVTYIAPELQ